MRVGISYRKENVCLWKTPPTKCDLSFYYVLF